MITSWNRTVVINTFFALWTISITLTYLGQAEIVQTMIFIWAVIIVFTSLDTFAIDAFTIHATIKIFIT